jgi:predicted O-methyltransferase YrrM
MKTEDRYTAPSEDCPHPEWWHSEDEQATEEEVLELFHALTRALQPELVLETGSYKGHGAFSIGTALKANGHGHLVTLEMDRSFAQEAQDRVRELPVTVCNTESLRYRPDPDTQYDLVLLDSGPGTLREREFHYFREYMTERTVLIVHDTAPHQRPLYEAFEYLFEECWISRVNLPTPRGVLIGRVEAGNMM